MPTFVMVDGVGGPGITLVFEDSKSGTTTWSGVNFGTPDPNRILVITASDGALTPPTGITVTPLAGSPVAATRQVNGTHAHIWTVPMPTGSSGSITLTGSSSATLQAIGVYALYGASSPVPTSSNTAATTSTSLTVVAGEPVVACGTAIGSTTGLGAWTGVTQDYSAIISGNQSFGGGSGVAASSGSLSVSFSTAGATNSIAVATW